MSIRNRVPPAIVPYLQLQSEASFIVLTGTLGYSPNWLTALFVGSILGSTPNFDANADDIGKHAVVLVSWMRDANFWKDEIRRTTGLDTSKLPQQDRFVFLDRLSSSTQSSFDSSNALVHLEQSIKETASKLSAIGAKVILILDNPDVLLATKSSTAQNLNHSIMKLRTTVHSSIVCFSADSPLVSASLQSPTAYSLPMEIETATFVIQQCHNARLVMSVRGISSGAAVDVSGELRITIGGGYDLEDTTQHKEQEIELLYLVHRDGSVRVFRRGEGTT